MMYQNNISFAGAGRVAGALCSVLFRAGFIVDMIVSETEASGKSLAGSCNSVWSKDLRFPDSTNVIIVAVPDHRLKNVLEGLICNRETLVVHTAGSFGLDIFPSHFQRTGVLYPLQTFSKNRKLDFHGLPFLLETSDNDSSEVLKSMCDAIHGKAYFVNTQQRTMLHLAAVFVCNFTNHLLTTGKEVAQRAGFSFDILAPLINETISKAMDSGPENSQTGPAVRHDTNTIEKHLELLSFSPELQRIYKEMTRSIIEYYKNPPTPLKGGSEG
jgi:predicted short-subunit dehydrogenase-like oxidoreductase (DUF2520 family)